MPVSLRATSEDARGTSGQPVPAPPTGTTSGDLLIAVQTCDSNGSLGAMTAPSGWTLVGSGSRGADVGYMKVWRRAATSSEPATYSFSDDSDSHGSVVILGCYGHDSSAPISVTPAFGNGGATANHTAPSVSATEGDLLITGHLAGTDGTGRTYTTPSGMSGRTSRLSSSPNILTGAYAQQIGSGGGTGTRTATCSGSEPYLTMSLVVTDNAASTPGGGGDPVTYLSNSEDSRGAATHAVPAPPPDVEAGDLLVAIQTSDLNGSLAGMTGATGWTEVGGAGRADAGWMKVWTRTATASEPSSYTFADESDAHGSVVIAALYNHDPTTPIPVAPAFANGSASTSHTAPTTAGAASGVLLTAHLAGTGGTTRSYPGAPSGMTLVRQTALTSGGNILTGVYRQDLTAAATTDAKTATCSAGTPWVAVALVVAPPTAAQAQTITSAGGIGTVEAFGTPAVATSQAITAAGGIASAAELGAPIVSGVGVDQTVTTIGIPTVAAFGIPAVSGGGAPTGARRYPGTATYPGAVAYPLSGTAGGGGNLFPDVTTFPDATTFPGTAGGGGNLFPDVTTFPDATTFPGEAPVPTGPQTVTALGIATVETFGIPAVAIPVPGEQTVITQGIDPVGALGVPLVALSGVAGLLPDDALYPAEDLYPSDDLASTAQTVVAIGIATAAVFGSPVVALADGPQSVVTTSIDPVEAFGTPTVTGDVAPDTILTFSIDSAEAFGRPQVYVEVPPPVTLPGAYFDTYYVDGIDLSSYATQIEVAEGLQETPGTVGDDVVIPGVDGAVQVYGGLGQQRRADTIGRITFSMWLIGVDPVTGTIPGGSTSAQEYMARWDELVRLFHRRMVTIDHPRPDGSIRRAVAHLLPGESMAPSSRSASPWFGRLKATFAIPAAHWTDTAAVTTGQQSLTSGQSLSLAAFAGATAPCTDLEVVFGAGNNPRLSTSTGHVGWNGVITAGRQLGINTANGTLHQAGGSAWTPGYDGLTYAPGPRLFEIDPTESLQAVFSHTGGGAMTVEVSGKRRYRTS